jgi:hypothetical protein
MSLVCQLVEQVRHARLTFVLQDRVQRIEPFPRFKRIDINRWSHGFLPDILFLQLSGILFCLEFIVRSSSPTF